MGRILKGTPLSYVNPKQVVWVRTTAGDLACTAETEINSSLVTVIVQDNGTAHAFCESTPRESYRRIVRNERSRPRVEEFGVKYLIAILYEVLNGTNSEIWLQDDGGEPVLITTIPTRISLGWSVYTPSVSEQPDGALRNIFVGHVQRQRPTFRVALDPRATWNPAEGIVDQNMSITLSDIPNGIDLGYSSGDFSSVGDRFITFFGSGSPNTFFANYGFNASPSALTQLTTRGIFSDGETVTINSIANFCDASLQRRKNGTWVYLRHGLYASQTEPFNNDMTTNAWTDIVYWGNGALIDPEEPDPNDITTSALEEPRGNNLIVADPASPWEGNTLRTNVFDNATAYSTTESLSSFLSSGATVENVPITISKPGGGTPRIERQSFKGAPANARQILSVAIYPK